MPAIPTDHGIAPIPSPAPADPAVAALWGLGALAERLALVERTRLWHVGGRPENVAEHSLMLALIAPVLAEALFPDLDASLVSRMAAVHDAVEAYVGDTATDRIDDAGLAAKAEREAAGLAVLADDFAALPGFVGVVERYEAQACPESRFVRMLDETMPALMVALGDRDRFTATWQPRDWLEMMLDKSSGFRGTYPDLSALLDVHDRLCRLVAARHESAASAPEGEPVPSPAHR